MQEINDLKQQLALKDKQLVQLQQQRPLCSSCGFQIQQKKDEDIDCKVIEMFRIFRCLWDTESPEYKNLDKKQDARVSIMLHCDFQNTKQVDIKLRQLRVRYRKEKDRVERSMRSGCGVDDVYKPTWDGFNKLDEFLAASFDGQGPWKYRRKTNLDPFVPMKPVKNPAEIQCPIEWRTMD